MSMIGYNASLGMRASAPIVPAKTVGTLTNNQGSPTTQIAVLHQVAPNNNNPSTASVLIQNRFPPVPGFALPSGFGPVYPAGTAGVTGPFINNPTTFEGGSFVTVDTVTNTVIGLQQGISNQFPSSATTQIANHVHTGAVDTSTGFPMPEEIDLVNHVQGQLTKPNYAEMPVGTYANVTLVTATADHVGYPAYNEAIVFNLDHYGTTSNPWLNQIQVVAIPVGAPQNTAENTGKVLYDTVPALVPGTAYDGSTIGGTGAQYKVYVGGLTAGIAYNIYVVYIDFYGNQSFYTTTGGSTGLLYTTSANPITVTNLPGLGTLPTVTDPYDSIAYTGVGQTTFNANVKFEINYTGTTADQWLQEIRLYATLWDNNTGAAVALSNGSTGPILVNIIDPNVSSDTNLVYFAEWPGLSLGNGTNTNLVYQLSLTFVAENNDESAQQVIGYTTNQVVTIYKPALAAIASTAPNATLVGTPTFPFNGNPLYDCDFYFQVDTSGTNSNLSLNFIQILAYRDGVPTAPILYDMKVPQANGTDYTGASTGTSGSLYHAYVGGMTGGSGYTIQIQYVDFAGNKSNLTTILDTTTYGTHAVTNNVLPGVGGIPTHAYSDIAYSQNGQSTFNAMVAFSVNYTGSDAINWMQEIELYATLWDTVTNKPYLYIDGVTYATPTLVNIIAAIPLSTGTENYIGEFPGLSVLYQNVNPATYRLGIRYVSQNGQKTDNSYTNGMTYGSQSANDPTYYLVETMSQSLAITRPILATFSPTAISPSVSCTAQMYLSQTQAQMDLTFSLPTTGGTDAVGYKSNPNLDKIRIFACNTYPYVPIVLQGTGDGSGTSEIYYPSNPNTVTGEDITLSVNNANIYQICEKYNDITPQDSGSYMTSFTLPVGNAYIFFIMYLDHSGRAQCPYPMTLSTTSVFNQLAGTSQTGSTGGISSKVAFPGYFCTFSSGFPYALINTNTSGSATVASIKYSSIYTAFLTIPTDSYNYSLWVEYVDFWMEPSGGGTITQKQRLPVTSTGVYTPVFTNLSPSTAYRVYFQYIGYGASNNKWSYVAPDFASNANTYITMTMGS